MQSCDVDVVVLGGGQMCVYVCACMYVYIMYVYVCGVFVFVSVVHVCFYVHDVCVFCAYGAFESHTYTLRNIYIHIHACMVRCGCVHGVFCICVWCACVRMHA
jgi:hypothetical protein